MDKQKKLYERMLISCVLMLIICVVLKLFGANWFDLETNIPILVKIDKIVNNNYFIMTFISVVLSQINMLFVLALTNKVSIKQTLKFCIITAPITILIFKFKDYTNIMFLELLVDTLYLLIVANIQNYFVTKNSIFKTCKNFIIVFIFNFIFQFLSLYIKSVCFKIGYYGLIIDLLLNLDYYIILIIWYLFQMKGDMKWTIQVFGSFLQRKLWKKPTQNLKQSSNKGGCKDE